MWCFGLLVVMKCTLAVPAASEGATFCQTYRPVQWSSSDTRRTKEQVDGLNRVYKRICRK